MNYFALWALLFLIFLPTSGFGYVGPGAGITFLGALWAVSAAVILALIGLLLWPIRVLLRRKKQRTASAEEQETGSTTQDE